MRSAAGTLLLVGPADGPVAAVDAHARQAGWQVRQAADGFAALEIVSADAALNAVLLDIEPFGSRSAGLADAIRSTRPALPLYLLCPAWLEPEARRIVGGPAADGYMVAPVGPDDLQLLQPTGLAAAPAATVPASSTTPPGLEQLIDRLSEPTPTVLELLAAWASQSLGGRAVALRWQARSAACPREPAGPAETFALAAADGQPTGEVRVAPTDPDGASRSDTASVVRLTNRLLVLHQRIVTLGQMAFTDSLTGAFNRRYLMSFLDRLIARAQRESFRITLLMLDIDDFKNYNDTFGHTVGDEILVDIARLMRQTSRPHDVIARIGGDEFAVLFWESCARPPCQPSGRRQPGSQHPAESLAFTERFRAALASHRFRSLGASAQGTLTISGGLARFPDDATDAGALLAWAGSGLKKAKSSGKNRTYLVGPQAGEA